MNLPPCSLTKFNNDCDDRIENITFYECSRQDIRGACLPKVDKRGKYTMRARVAMPCTCAW